MAILLSFCFGYVFGLVSMVVVYKVASSKDPRDPYSECEGCGSPATTVDAEGVPLCEECAKACEVDDRLKQRIDKLPYTDDLD